MPLVSAVAHDAQANVTCVPSTPAPARKRRRPNQDLQQRLARCEELLAEYSTAKPPVTPEQTPHQPETWKPLGQLIDDGGSAKFVDNYLFARMHDEVSSRDSWVTTCFLSDLYPLSAC
jgi:hypothetical protein